MNAKPMEGKDGSRTPLNPGELVQPSNDLFPLIDDSDCMQPSERARGPVPQTGPSPPSRLTTHRHLPRWTIDRHAAIAITHDDRCETAQEELDRSGVEIGPRRHDL